MKFLIVVEETDAGYSASSPDLPGCVATGDSPDEVEQAMREAIELHVDGMHAEGLEVPEPQSYATILDVRR
jgi:predicted RNase H-like HicB family nuclease